MPFKSKAQMAYMYSQHPQIAKRWRKEHPKQDLKSLPKHLSKELKKGK